MELEGHPTQDMVDELQRRGARLFSGGEGGPSATATPADGAAEREARSGALWLFLPAETFDTQIDDPPNKPTG